MQNNWSEFLSDDFINSRTAFETVPEFLRAAKSAIECGIDTNLWNYFIYETTDPGSWEEMLAAVRGAEGSPDKS
jgi:hypothetical protein